MDNPKGLYRWTFGIPDFFPGHKFVYLDDLIDRNNGRYLAGSADHAHVVDTAKRKLHEKSLAHAVSVAGELMDNTTINSALEFLNNAATAERRKELMVIQEYKKQLENTLPAKDKQMIEYLETLNPNLLENPDKINDFYLNLTKYINYARQDTTDYLNRLKRFKSHNTKAMDELPQDSYEFRALGDLQGTYNNLIGIATRAQEKSDFTKKFRDATFKYITESNLVNRLKTAEDIAAAFTIVQLDIEKKCQQYLDTIWGDDLSKLTTEEYNKAMDTIVDEYLNQDRAKDTKLQQAVDEDNEQLTLMLDAAKDVIGFKQLTEGASAQKKKSNRRTALLNPNVSLRKKLRGIISDTLLEDLQTLTTSIPQVKSKMHSTFHGNLYEVIQVVQEGNTIKIQGTNGTDIVHLGSMEFDILPLDLQNSFTGSLKKINKVMTDYNQETRKNRKDVKEAAQKEMNDRLREQMELAEKQIKNLQLNIENLFVYHESLKLYKTAETNEMSSFEGRDMVILNYIDTLYTANGLAELTLPQKDGLEFLAMNISSLAVGHNFKSTLTDYLSIFAGLLMFDDVYNIALEANAVMQGSTQNNVIKQIHLYNLNGVYVPASMILTYTYTTMKQIQEAMNAKRAAKAHISTSDAEEHIKSYLDVRPQPLKPQWDILAEQVASGTKVRISFLAGFVELINQLLQI